MSGLPRGLGQDAHWWTDWTPDGEAYRGPAKCECGASITMGKDDHYSFHSTWCPMYEEGRNNAEIQRNWEEWHGRVRKS
jgi:hypothetical protein